MNVRYGLLVQTAQLIAQLFLAWRAAEGPLEPFRFVVPSQALEDLPDRHGGILVTVAPVQETGDENRQP